MAWCQKLHFITLPLDGQGSPRRSTGHFPLRIEENEACLRADSVMFFQIGISVVTLFLLSIFKGESK